MGSRPGISPVNDSDSTSESDVQIPARKPEMRRNWAAGDGRVVQLRTEEYSALKRQTSVAYTRIFGDKGLPAHQIFPTDELSIFPADQQHGTEPFKTSPAV